ncbi:MAG: cysteine desulfurase family protein [Spirochaetales bacterium]
MTELYLDWAATTPIHPEALKILTQVYEEIYGNPSSIHQWGVKARELLESSRARFAELLGASPNQVVFTSGGSESNNLVFTSLLLKPKAHAIVPLLEHASVYEPSRILERLGWEVTRIPSAGDGRIDPLQVISSLRKNTSFIALMWVNNETGALQPVADVIREARKVEQRPLHIHVDAVQGVGKFPLQFQQLGADSLSISAHKFRGPRGVGALLVKKPFPSLLVGGGQERGIRPGTENVAGIAGMVKALEIAVSNKEENFQKAQQVMDTLLLLLKKCRQCKILPEDRLLYPDRYSPYIVSIAFPPLPGEVLVRVLNEKGFGVSTGSACSSRKKRDTRVLEASGVSSTLAFSSLRVSIGPTITEKEIQTFAQQLLEEVRILFQVAK